MTRRSPRPVPSILLGLILAPLATIRLTRFITADWLGEWLIDKPARDWAVKHEIAAIENPKGPSLGRGSIDGPVSWQGKLVKGLDCPFCVGYWIGLGVLSAVVVCPKPLRKPLYVLLGSLGMNYLIGHVSKRID